MSIIKPNKGNDQLLLDDFRYRRDRFVWRCVKNKCEGRARSDSDTFKMYQDHTGQVMRNLAALIFTPPQHVIEEFVRIKENASDVLDGKYISYK
ncbi:unnamed protein product [Adineta steineri]|uniref:FLYWCH-type domain-containing protein n=1 Tax=Adineta steineri TaxID=433720 RepID=A0A819WGN4_9BILA|nr:unnamed protein product [Adineta steineri]CAF4125415.1 unnamed protein product [Adineta steineri]